MDPQPTRPSFTTTIANIEDNEFEYIKALVYKHTGIFLAPHKKIMVQSRLNARLRALGIKDYVEYVNKLKREPSFSEKEIPEIVNKITTNKTDFFRENHHFLFLKDEYFPKFEEESKQTGNKNLRIWCSASSTGEEPYSIAITCQEYFQNKPSYHIKIYASDIDTNVLETAKQGKYKSERLATVTDSMKRKYFTESKDEKATYFTANQNLKSILEFRKLNLLEQPYAFSEKFDLVFCRNVIIYFDKQTQKKIFAGFEQVMKPHSYLILGHSETMFGISDAFKFLGHTIYQKKT